MGTVRGGPVYLRKTQDLWPNQRFWQYCFRGLIHGLVLSLPKRVSRPSVFNLQFHNRPVHGRLRRHPPGTGRRGSKTFGSARNRLRRSEVRDIGRRVPEKGDTQKRRGVPEEGPIDTGLKGEESSCGR